MKNIFTRKSLCAALILMWASLSTGCTATRAVTASYWHSDDVFYIAYLETKGGIEAEIKKCKVQADNSMKCTKQAKVNKTLNK